MNISYKYMLYCTIPSNGHISLSAALVLLYVWCYFLSERCLDTFISRSPSSNMASSQQTDHGPPSPQTDHGPPSPQTDHGPPSPHADLGPFVERTQNPHRDGEDPCSTENMDETDMLYSEQRVQMLQNNGSIVCVELRDHGPLSTHHGDDLVIRNSVDDERVNNLDSNVNTLNTETQFHSQRDHWRKQGRTNSLTILATPPDSLCHMDLSQQSSGRTDSQGFSESSRIGETTQTSDSEPNFQNIAYSEESTDPETASGIDRHKQSQLSVEYTANICDSTQDGRQHDVATRWPCSAASGGNLQLTDGHVDSDSARKDAADVQPVIQEVVGFSIVLLHLTQWKLIAAFFFPGDIVLSPIDSILM